MKLTADDAQRVVLVQSFEETDRAGRVLSKAARRDASGSQPASEDEDGWLSARARRLMPALAEQVPHLDRLLGTLQLARGLTLPVVVLAFLIGLSTNALGPTRHIHVLALPLLGIVAWNLAVLGLLLVRRFLPAPPTSGRLVALLEGWTRRAVERWPRGGGDTQDADTVARALYAHVGAWLPRVAPLAKLRLSTAMHCGAAAMVTGVVGGMYLRGVAFDYQATWESTFLGTSTVEALLRGVLAPAASLTGISVPDVAAIERPASGPAAPWIHLWATTALVLVVLPRLVLAGLARVQCARLDRRFPLDLPAAYLRRIRAAVDPTRRRVTIVPYSHRPTQDAVGHLKEGLYDLLGPRAEITVHPALDYGDALEALALGDASCVVLLLNLAQTPEVEVHGELCASLVRELAGERVLIALLDAGPYLARGGATAGERLASRRAGWRRVVEASGLTPVDTDLSPAGEDGERGTSLAERLLAGCSEPELLGLGERP